MDTDSHIQPSRTGCRNCIQRFKGADGRRRCRVHGGLAGLLRSAERICTTFIHDTDRKEAACSSINSNTD